MVPPGEASIFEALDHAKSTDPTPAAATRLLNRTREEAWGKIQQHPTTYVPTREEYAVLNYFQERYKNSQVFCSAVARFWQNYKGITDHVVLQGSADRKAGSKSNVVQKPQTSKDPKDVSLQGSEDAQDEDNTGSIPRNPNLASNKESNHKEVIEQQRQQLDFAVSTDGDIEYTQISKDLVSNDALGQMQYNFTRASGDHSIMAHLEYDDICALVELTESLRSRGSASDTGNSSGWSENDMSSNSEQTSQGHSAAPVQDSTQNAPEGARKAEEGGEVSSRKNLPLKPPVPGEISYQSSDLLTLKDLKRSADGGVYDWQRNLVGQLREGKLAELKGRTAHIDREIVDKHGDIIGRAVRLPANVSRGISDRRSSLKEQRKPICKRCRRRCFKCSGDLPCLMCQRDGETCSFRYHDQSFGFRDGTSALTFQRACDSCNRRGRECDLGFPCSSCSPRTLTCRYIAKIDKKQNQNTIRGESTQVLNSGVATSVSVPQSQGAGSLAYGDRCTIKILEVTYQLKAIGEETTDLLRTTEHVNRNVNEAHRLRRLKYAPTSNDERIWMDRVIENTEKALREVAHLIEPAQVEVDTATQDYTGSRNRSLWVFRDSPEVRDNHKRLSICHQSLMSVVGSFFTRDAVVVTPVEGEQPPPYDPEMEAMLNWRRKRIRSTVSGGTSETASKPPSSVPPANIGMTVTQAKTLQGKKEQVQRAGNLVLEPSSISSRAYDPKLSERIVQLVQDTRSWTKHVVNTDIGSKKVEFLGLPLRLKRRRQDKMEQATMDKERDAYVQWHGKQWDLAMSLQRGVVKTRVRVWGVEHLDTMASKANLAFMYWRQGRFEEAKDVQFQALEATLSKFGADSGASLASKADLAFLYQISGRVSEANTLKTQIEEASSRVTQAFKGTMPSITLISLEQWSQKLHSLQRAGSWLPKLCDDTRASKIRLYWQWQQERQLGPPPELWRPKTKVEFLAHDTFTWLDSVKTGFERSSGREWDWWPLSPPNKQIERGQVRLRWRCTCGSLQSIDISQSLARSCAKYRTMMPVDVSNETQATTSKGGNLNQSPNSSVPTQNTSRSSHPSSQTLGKQSLSVHSCRNGVPPSSELTNNLFILLAINQSAKTDHTQLETQTRIIDDAKLFTNIRMEYRRLRGLLRYCLSPFIFSHCSFVKYTRFYVNELAHIGPSLPVDPQYVYSPRPPGPHDDPPISAHEFNRRFYSNLCNPCGRGEALQRIPKRTKRFQTNLHLDGREDMWGLHVELRPSFFRVLLWQITITAAGWAFMGWWLSRHSGDLQGAAVPITMILTALVSLWVPLWKRMK